jgi:hypothetical protein
MKTENKILSVETSKPRIEISNKEEDYTEDANYYISTDPNSQM